MQYMFLLYRDESHIFERTEAELAVSRQWDIMEETERKGILRGASPLQFSQTAVSLKHSNGALRYVDGPYTETKEALGGFYILECSDAEEARRWGERMASTGCAVGVEIRPLAAIPARVQSMHADLHA